MKRTLGIIFTLLMIMVAFVGCENSAGGGEPTTPDSPTFVDAINSFNLKYKYFLGEDRTIGDFDIQINYQYEKDGERIISSYITEDSPVKLKIGPDLDNLREVTLGKTKFQAGDTIMQASLGDSVKTANLTVLTKESIDSDKIKIYLGINGIHQNTENPYKNIYAKLYYDESPISDKIRVISDDGTVKEQFTFYISEQYGVEKSPDAENITYTKFTTTQSIEARINQCKQAAKDTSYSYESDILNCIHYECYIEYTDSGKTFKSQERDIFFYKK